MIKFDFNKTPITQIADYIIISSARSNASDIHFDPREDGMMVRIRVDGDLQNFTFIPKAYERNLTTRLKLLANMNITESRLPQDGAIKGNFGGTYLDMRVSCLPLNEGEKIVIRILDYTRSLQGLDSLGFNEQNLARLKRMIRVPNGIILITGETGSGKSTTVYSILETLNREETNIITVEDPIEMNIEGLNQVQVNAEIGMTFAAALRSILRQDPDVVLVGEIRDGETANLAVQAALTGHLVFSTLHTNSAAGILPRLLDMGVEPFLIASTINTVIGQRLVRRVAPDKETYQSTEMETEMIKSSVGYLLPKNQAEMQSAEEDLGYSNLPLATSQSFTLTKGKDTPTTPGGYKGRIGLYEVMEITDEIQQLIIKHATSSQIQKVGVAQGMIPMHEDGMLKALQGLTTVEEVNRVAANIA